ncbi:MAG: hypothetical protein V2I57_13885 [Xanthomonadales bacterium]|nr:hypothetical protein [Xanthomonadales bacterium]
MAKVTRRYLIQPGDPRLDRAIVGTPLGKRPSETPKHDKKREREKDKEK